MKTRSVSDEHAPLQNRALRANGRAGRAAVTAEDSGRVKLTVYLSREATEYLEHLRFKRLDRKGNKPTGSEVIEGLLRTALKNERIPAYPAPRS